MAQPESRSRCAAFLLLSTILSGCASRAPLPASEHLADVLSALAVRHHVCAVTVAVIKDRKLDAIVPANGCAKGAAPHADSVFQAASLSKPVFAYAVLGLVAQGKMALDASVLSYLPQGYRHRFDPLAAQPSELVSDPRLGDITVRMALNHTSGLPGWASGPLRVVAQPGSAWRYSGEGYMLLQRAVEAVTGEPLDRTMRTRVFAPLGMRHSDYVWGAGFAAQIVPGTKANGAARKTIDLASPVAAFSLYTSAADYARFVTALLNDAALLRQTSASPAPVDTALGLGWGLGWGIEQSQDDVYLWQWGNNPGYRAFAIASVRSGDGFVMLSNSENGLKLAEPLAERLLPGKRSLFQSSVMDGDILTALCTSVRICL